MVIGQCDVCNKPMRGFVIDVVEASPQHGYANYVPYRRAYLCDNHWRLPLRLLSDEGYMARIDLLLEELANKCDAVANEHNAEE